MRYQRKLWPLLPLVPIALSAQNFAGCSYALGSRVGRHVAAATASKTGLKLPSFATDICFYVHGASGPYDLWEYAAPKTEFLVWAQANGLPMQEITPDQDAIKINRYGYGTAQQSDPASIQVENGYSFLQVDPAASDRRLLVVYDNKLQRAFFYQSFR